ncbi:hypothetical protein Dimus_039017 [Dionaea muscipula]
MFLLSIWLIIADLHAWIYSNASDALDKLRFLGVTDPRLLKDAADLDIRIQTDNENGIITITDTGIGMTRQELVDCLGTIAQSGTAKFLKALKVHFYDKLIDYSICGMLR